MPNDVNLGIDADERRFLSRSRQSVSQFQSRGTRAAMIGLLLAIVANLIWSASEARLLDTVTSMLPIITIIAWIWDKARDVGKLIRIIDRQTAENTNL